MEIQEIKSEDELREAFPVMRELRSKVDEREYFRLLEHMVKEGYRLLLYATLALLLLLLVSLFSPTSPMVAMFGFTIW